MAITRNLFSWAVLACCFPLAAASQAIAQEAPYPTPTAVLDKAPSTTPLFPVRQQNEKLTMLVDSARIVTLEKRIPQVRINNPEVLSGTPLSPSEVQLVAKKIGRTQVFLWDENDQIYSIDVVVMDDARELNDVLATEFPTAQIQVRPFASKVLVSGKVDRPQDADQIKRIVDEYYGGGDKVISNLTVGGVQQVALQIKLYEVSRTKLRNLGFDWAYVSNGGFVATGVSQLVQAGTSGVSNGLRTINGNNTLTFMTVDNGSSFFGIMEALRRDNLAKILAEPTLVTTSGRPACFLVGGELPYTVPQGFGQLSIEWKKYGTRLDFVPIVLGNGQIRLEVRPEVSEVDNGRNMIEGVPAIKVSMVDTGVTMETGQTLAIAGLVQRRTEAQLRAVPLVGEIPYVGAMFSSKREEVNEIETLVLVTPQLVEPMSADEVNPCGPGTRTTSPGDWDFYLKGRIESPNPCPPCNAPQCGVSVQGAPTAAPGIESVPLPPEAIPPVPGQSGYHRAGAAPAVARNVSASRYNAQNPAQRGANSSAAAGAAQLPGFGGPIGYDR